jgi:hypothetical protein
MQLQLPLPWLLLLLHRCMPAREGDTIHMCWTQHQPGLPAPQGKLPMAGVYMVFKTINNFFYVQSLKKLRFQHTRPTHLAAA